MESNIACSMIKLILSGLLYKNLCECTQFT